MYFKDFSWGVHKAPKLFLYNWTELHSKSVIGLKMSHTWFQFLWLLLNKSHCWREWFQNSVMAQFDCGDENSSIIPTLQSCSGHPVSRMISQIQTMKTRKQISLGFSMETNSVQDTGGLEDSIDSLKCLEDIKYGPHWASWTR